VVHVVYRLQTQQERRRLARITRTINLVIEVYHPKSVVIERELVFTFNELFAVQSLRVESATLRLNVETSLDIQWWQYVPPSERRGVLTIYFNGVRVYEKGTGERDVHAIEVNIDPRIIRRENRARIEFSVVRGIYTGNVTVRMRLTRCELELVVSVSEDRLDDLVVAERASAERNRQIIESSITPAPNRTVTPTSSDPVSSFLSVIAQLPSAIIAVIVLFILIELVRVFRR
jgi:hypothetical protein